MEIIEAFAAKNKCYQAGAALVPRGLMLHSIGTPQPSAAALARYFDQYQPGGQSVCVHAFAQADGTVYQTLPWEMRGWHCGGAANNTHIGIEMTEPGAGMAYAEAAAQITDTYRTAVALFAQLCETYGLDPLADGVIIGHAEGHRISRRRRRSDGRCAGGGNRHDTLQYRGRDARMGAGRGAAAR